MVNHAKQRNLCTLSDLFTLEIISACPYSKVLKMVFKGSKIKIIVNNDAPQRSISVFKHGLQN